MKCGVYCLGNNCLSCSIIKDIEDDQKKSLINTEVIEIDDFDDHRLTLRIPRSLMTRIDIKRKKRIGKISRNLYILEILEKATLDNE